MMEHPEIEAMARRISAETTRRTDEVYGALCALSKMVPLEQAREDILKFVAADLSPWHAVDARRLLQHVGGPTAEEIQAMVDNLVNPPPAFCPHGRRAGAMCPHCLGID